MMASANDPQTAFNGMAEVIGGSMAGGDYEAAGAPTSYGGDLQTQILDGESARNGSGDCCGPPDPFRTVEVQVAAKVEAVKEAVSDAAKSVWNAFKGFDASLAGSGEKGKSKQGGYDFRSDLKNGNDSDSQQKRKGDRNTETKDVTGFDAASGLSGGKSNNQTKKVMDVLEKGKDGMAQGDNISNAKDIYKEMKKSDTTKAHYYTTGGKYRTTESYVNGKIVKSGNIRKRK